MFASQHLMLTSFHFYPLPSTYLSPYEQFETGKDIMTMSEFKTTSKELTCLFFQVCPGSTRLSLRVTSLKKSWTPSDQVWPESSSSLIPNRAGHHYRFEL